MSLLPLPLQVSRLEIELAFGAAALVAGAVGWHFYDAHERALGAQACESRVQAVNAENHAQVEIYSGKADTLAAQLAASQAARKARHDDIQKALPAIVDRPVYALECIDDDGLRNINRALAGDREADSASSASPGLPGASGPER